MTKRNRKKRISTGVPITPSVLKWAMVEAGFTVETLAEKLKVTPDTVRGWLAEAASEPPQVRLGSNVEDAAADARKRLTGSLNGSFGGQWRNESQAFQGWRDVLERSGVLVFVLPLGKDSCRGFSLWDDHAPL